MAKINPFITSGYVSAEYFCDRINSHIDTLHNQR